MWPRWVILFLKLSKWGWPTKRRHCLLHYLSTSYGTPNFCTPLSTPWFGGPGTKWWVTLIAQNHDGQRDRQAYNRVWYGLRNSILWERRLPFQLIRLRFERELAFRVGSHSLESQPNSPTTFVSDFLTPPLTPLLASRCFHLVVLFSATPEHLRFRFSRMVTQIASTSIPQCGFATFLFYQVPSTQTIIQILISTC